MRRTMVFICLVMVGVFQFFIAYGATAQGLLFMVGEDGKIYQLNPGTGATLNSFAIPSVAFSGEGPNGLAYGNGSLFYVDGYADNKIYQFNASTGATITSFAPPAGSEIDGLGFSDTFLFAQDFNTNKIYVLNPATGAVINTFNFTTLRGGLTFAGSRNTVFATNFFTSPTTIYEINSTTGSVINTFSAPPGSGEIFGLSFSVERKTLFLGDADLAKIYEVNPDNGALINSFDTPIDLAGAPIAPYGLAGDESVPPAQPVPTMGEWGMIILVILLGVGSLYHLKKRRAAV
jgi:outer membrane protein assembly factor BamB